MQNMRLSVLALLGVITVMLLSPKNILAVGEGSPAECNNPIATVDGNQNTLSYAASGDNIITGVCIKSGSNMAEGAMHTGLLGNGTYENGCYQVSGVGTSTSTVTVERIGAESSTCQALSHIDVFSASPTPTPSPTPTSTPGLASTPSPSPTPTSTPGTTSTTTTTSGGGAVAGASATNDSTPTPTPTPTPAGAVLGAAAELPETGTVSPWLLLALIFLLSGASLITWGLYKKES